MTCYVVLSVYRPLESDTRAQEPELWAEEKH
jgi:hypothetical protein